ncbi:hypothetical protein [Solidesulfovibrio carbinolicus]|uniref:hypothetical protein n=1 Tax=Solidesulfovibrio carbinolicus TaxID=296842 RepID=UPI001011488D|nr:hypothetical protein [Solidesulfovibrio carbinolicus]
MREERKAIDIGRKVIIPPQNEREDRSDFVRMTVTVPPEIYSKLVDEMAQQKKARSGSGGISGVVRDALELYFRNR